jgi:hypothetical protein
MARTLMTIDARKLRIKTSACARIIRLSDMQGKLNPTRL